MSAERALRIGLIGAGNIAAAHVQAFSQCADRVQVAAVCDIDEGRAARLAGELGATAYTDVAQMIAEAPIDAVDVCTTHDQHAEAAVAAADAGYHVLVEKPMACSLSECRAMVDAADKAGVTLMIAQYQRYVAIYRGVKELLDAGEIGAVRAVRLDTMQNLLDPYLSASYPAGHWLFDGSRAGGGIVISVSVHKIDLLRYFVGDLVRVNALCRTMDPAFINGAEDYAVALLEFENGAVGELFGTYSGFRVPWGEHFTIFGEQGAIYGMAPHPEGKTPAMVASASRLAQLPEPGHDPSDDFVAVPPSGDLPTEHPLVNQILHFADCCATGAEPISSGRDNLGTMKAIFAIYESSRTGKPIALASL